MTVQSPPYALQNASHSAALFRQASTSFINSFGVANAGEYSVIQTGTPSMAVGVGPGRAWLPGGSVSNITGFTFSTQAGYFAFNDNYVTITVAAADPTNPRIDVVYLAVNDSFYSGASNNAVVGVVTGTPAVSPVAPPAPTNSLILATIAVAASSTTVVNANITQLQPLLGLQPAVLPYMELTSSTTQSTATGAYTQITSFNGVGASAGTGLTSSPSGITVASAGRYRVTGLVPYTVNATGGRIAIISSTGAGGVYQSSVGNASGTLNTIVEVTYPLTVAANATIALYAYQTSGAALNTVAGARLYVERLAG